MPEISADEIKSMRTLVIKSKLPKKMQRAVFSKFKLNPRERNEFE